MATTRVNGKKPAAPAPVVHQAEETPAADTAEVKAAGPVLFTDAAGHEWTMDAPAKFNVVLRYVRISTTVGLRTAEFYLIEQSVGAKGLDALIDMSEDRDTWYTAITRAVDHHFGRTEAAKAEGN